MKSPQRTDYAPHPIAKVFPPWTKEHLAELVDDIKANGLREEIVLYEDQVLDGVHRLTASLDADVPPRFREFGSRPTDGDDPAAFAMSLNQHRRHLPNDPGARAAIANEMLPYFKSLTAPGRATERAADAFQVSDRAVRRAATVAAHAPERVADVKAGTITLGAAEKEALKKKKNEEDEKLREAEALENNAEAEETKKFRAACAKRWIKPLSKEFAEAVEKGVVLKSTKELKEFDSLKEDEDRKLIKHLVVEGWSVQRAVKFMRRTADGKTTVEEMVRFAQGLNDKFKVAYGGYIVSVRKSTDGD